MKFEQLDAEMRVFERSLDQTIIPGMWMAARIDGRSFTRLTKEVCQYEAPFDIRFRDAMLVTVEHLMECGFRVIYGYTESDEISLLFHPGENAFGRKIRKYNSILAGEASAAFSLAIGRIAAFDCRMIPLPNISKVKDYFFWRQEDASRNALNSWCYWTLRKEGSSAAKATELLSGQSIAWKNEFLFQRGINFNDLPLWQKRGVGVYRKTVTLLGKNPLSGEITQGSRERLFVNTELPTRDEYRSLMDEIVGSAQQLDQ